MFIERVIKYFQKKGDNCIVDKKNGIYFVKNELFKISVDVRKNIVY